MVKIFYIIVSIFFIASQSFCQMKQSDINSGVDLKLEGAEKWFSNTIPPVPMPFLEILNDPLKEHTESVASISEDMHVVKRIISIGESVTLLGLTCDALLEAGNGNFHIGFVTTEVGENHQKGYFTLVNSATMALRKKGGTSGPWTTLTSERGTYTGRWIKLKFLWYKDGTLQLYVDNTLLCETVNKELPLKVDQVHIWTWGEGKKYFANVKLLLRE